MDIFSLITGLVFGLIALKIGKALFMFRIILTGFTTFLVLKIFYPHLMLWEVKDYFDNSNYKQLIKEPFFIYAIMVTMLLFLVIYFLLVKAIELIFEKRFTPFANRKLANIANYDNSEIESFLQKGLVPFFNFCFYLNKPTKKEEPANNSISYNKICNIAFKGIATTIHILIVWIFVFHLLISGIVLSFIFGLFSFLYLLGLPFMVTLKNTVSSIFCVQNNKHYQ